MAWLDKAVNRVTQIMSRRLIGEYAPDEAQGGNDGCGGDDHSQEAHEGEDVLAARDRVGEQQDRGDGVVQAPDDGDEQRAHDHGAREHLRKRRTRLNNDYHHN